MSLSVQWIVPSVTFQICSASSETLQQFPALSDSWSRGRWTTHTAHRWRRKTGIGESKSNPDSPVKEAFETNVWVSLNDAFYFIPNEYLHQSVTYIVCLLSCSLKSDKDNNVLTTKTGKSIPSTNRPVQLTVQAMVYPADLNDWVNISPGRGAVTPAGGEEHIEISTLFIQKMNII